MVQYEWIKEVLETWKMIIQIFWKGLFIHHALWGKYYFDYLPIVNNFMPILLRNNFDFYFCGHEHTSAHAVYNYNQTSFNEQVSTLMS